MPKGSHLAELNRARRKNLTGLRFGRLIVIEEDGKSKSNCYTYRCKCDCGNIKSYVATDMLTKGKIKSCGCYKKFVKVPKKKATIEEIRKRLKDNTEKNGECWIWKKFRFNTGYGQTKVHGKIMSAHKASYTYFIGDIPKGMNVLHKCDVKSCINPEHLYLGSHEDNMKDMMTRNRCVKNKLQVDQVLEIRKSYPQFSLRQLAQKFKVSQNAISKIVKYESWRYL